jgi:hypothetical protein
MQLLVSIVDMGLLTLDDSERAALSRYIVPPICLDQDDKVFQY